MAVFYSTTEFAKLISVTPQTLRNWEKENKFKPHHKSLGGHRFYSHDQISEYYNQAKELCSKEEEEVVNQEVTK